MNACSYTTYAFMTATVNQQPGYNNIMSGGSMLGFTQTVYLWNYTNACNYSSPVGYLTARVPTVSTVI